MPRFLYSPNQILAVGLLGGPLAAIHALKHNFDALGNAAGSQLVIRWGIAIVIALLSAAPFLQQDSPSFALQFAVPMGYSLLARLVAEGQQLTREQIADDPRYAFMPTGLLVSRSLLGMLAFMLLSVIWLTLLVNLGVVELPPMPVDGSAPAIDTAT